VPRVVGREGIISTIRPDLNTAELEALRASAELLKTTADAIGI